MLYIGYSCNISHASHKKWDDQEATRLERESTLLQYVKGLVEAEKQRQLAAAGEDAEKIDEINYLTVSCYGAFNFSVLMHQIL